MDVDQNLLGQVLGYGRVSIHAMGAQDAFNYIANPMPLQRSINEQLDQRTR